MPSSTSEFTKFHLGCFVYVSLFNFKLSHIIFIVCSLCAPGLVFMYACAMLLFRHFNLNFSDWILSILKPTNHTIHKAHARRRWWIHIYLLNCVYVAVCSFCKITTLFRTSFYFVRRLVWLNASLLIKIQKKNLIRFAVSSLLFQWLQWKTEITSH